MVVQRARISSVLGLGGTLGAPSMPSDWTDPELSKLVLEPPWSEGLRLPTLGRCKPAGLWRTDSSSELEYDSLDSLPEEKLERLDSVLVSVLLRIRLCEVKTSLSEGACDQLLERTSRDWALWSCPDALGSPSH